MPNKIKAEDAVTAIKYFDLPNNIYDLIALLEGQDDKKQYNDSKQKYAVQCVVCDSQNVIKGNSSFINLCEFCRTYYDAATEEQYKPGEIPGGSKLIADKNKSSVNKSKEYADQLPIHFNDVQIKELAKAHKVYDEKLVDELLEQSDESEHDHGLVPVINKSKTEKKPALNTQQRL